MKIKSLFNIDFNTIFQAFDQAFADYEMQLNKKQLETMLRRRGFNPSLSFAAFEDDTIVAFTFNGIGNFNGIQTAYDTGTGTLKEYRGQGLASAIFEYSIPHLKEAGIRQYLLEVLQHNTGAISVYSKLGFEISREFNYFNQENKEIRDKPVNVYESSSIREITLEEYPKIQDFWDFYPSWQNSFESIERAAEDFISLGIFTDNKLTGYCVFEPVSGDVTQLAVDKDYRRTGIASLLLKEILKLNKNNALKIINAEIECHSITAFLKSKNIDIKGKQFEMIKKL